MISDRTRSTRIMVYSHDAFGLGNLRRMLAICEQLLGNWPGLSILLVSGSPMIHEFRLPSGLDYIKLLCLNRGAAGQLYAKYLGTSVEETVSLRSHLIHLAAKRFKPDLLLVDKKPSGLNGELTATLDYLKNERPYSKCVLLLRDILDTAKKTVDEWVQWRYYQTLQTYYDQILIVGMQSVFDAVQEYRMPLSIAHKVRYCGYIRKPLSPSHIDLHSDLHRGLHSDLHRGLHAPERTVLVTPGGGEDGYDMVNNYLTGLKALGHSLKCPPKFHSLIICGPEMSQAQQQLLRQLAHQCSNVTLKSFASDMLTSLMTADVVVSMGGYNTVTEILSLKKPAVVIPRIKPSQEQFIRASRFAERGWITMLHPEKLTGRSLLEAVVNQLENPLKPPIGIDFSGLPQIAHNLKNILPIRQQPRSLTSLSA